MATQRLSNSNLTIYKYTPSRIKLLNRKGIDKQYLPERFSYYPDNNVSLLYKIQGFTGKDKKDKKIQ
jgi:hypothetical protein